MRVVATILLLVLATSTTSAQEKTTDCRDTDVLLEKVWKYYLGSPPWIAAIDSLISLCPQNASFIGDKAMTYMIRGEYAAGMKLLNQAAQMDPFFYLGNRAWYRMRYLRDHEGALRDLDELEKFAGRSLVYVSSTHMYILKGQSAQQLGRYDDALNFYNRAIDEQLADKGPDWVGVNDYIIRGILKYKMGDYDGAVTDFNQQIKMYETLSDTYYYRGLSYKALDRKDEARADLMRAKDLMLGDGQKRWESFVLVADEVFLSQVEMELLRLY